MFQIDNNQIVNFKIVTQSSVNVNYYFCNYSHEAAWFLTGEKCLKALS